MAHMKKIRFHAVNHKDSQHEFTKQNSFGTLSSIFLTKPVQQRCPTLLILLCDLNKNCTWLREQRWRKFWEQFLGRRQWLWWHPSWMGLMWAHSWIQCLLATEAFFCPELGIQVLSPQQQSLSIKHERHHLGLTAHKPLNLPSFTLPSFTFPVFFLCNPEG